MYMEKYIKTKTDLLLSILSNESLQLFSLYTVCILVPILVKEPQIVVGTLINIILLIGIIRFPMKKIFPILFLPSLTSYTYGLLLGSATPFLLYLIPFITIANYIYIKLSSEIKNAHLSILIPPITKAVFLYTSAYILYMNIGLPKVLLTSMGIMQLITATIASVSVGLLINKRKSY